MVIIMIRNELDHPWALCKLGGDIYGISYKNIVSIVILDQVISISHAPDFIRSAIDFRDKIIHIIDLRKMLGIKSIQEEVSELTGVLIGRKQDHINWLSELMNSVEEKREFKLTTDPHACAFGKWYDFFKTDDLMLKFLLEKFDKPHRKIHSIGVDVKHLEESGDYFAAAQLIAYTKNNELKEMISLFETLIKEYIESKREIVIVLRNDEKTLGIIVDEVISVEPLLQETGKIIENRMFNSNLFLCIGKRRKDSNSVVLLNDECFFSL